MIVCLFGTNPYSFERLAKKVDTTVANNYHTFMQIGNTRYLPVNCNFVQFEEKYKLLEKVKNAQLVIAQGGYGSMMDAIHFNKKIIAVPRMIDLNEALDDQLEIVHYFESKKYVVGCYDIEDLEGLVNKCLSDDVCFNTYVPECDNKISDMIDMYINEY